MERATAANDGETAEPTRIDGVDGIAVVMGHSRTKVRRLANREHDPLPLEHDDGGTFIMSDQLAAWKKRQRRSYREACGLGLVPGVQAAS